MSMQSFSYFLTYPDRSQKLPLSCLTKYEKIHFKEFKKYTGYDFCFSQKIVSTFLIKNVILVLCPHLKDSSF